MTKEEIVKTLMIQFMRVLLEAEKALGSPLDFDSEAELHDGRMFNISLGDKE